MARTMRDKIRTRNSSPEEKKKVSRVNKTIKKQATKSTKSPSKQSSVSPKSTKKNKIASQIKSKRTNSSSKVQKKDAITSLTAQILKKVQKQVKTYESNLQKSAEKKKTSKRIKEVEQQSDEEEGYQSPSESYDIEKSSAISDESSKRKRARQSKQQTRTPSKSPVPSKSNPISKKTTKTYKKLTRSGKQFGEVQLKIHAGQEGDDKELKLASAKKQTKSAKTQKKNMKEKALLESPDSNNKDSSQYEFLEQEDVTQTIRYRRPNKNLLIRDEQVSKDPSNVDFKNFSFINQGDKRNNIFSTSFQQGNFTMNTTTTASSRGCSISREDIQSENDSLNGKNSSVFLNRGNNKPKKTVCAKQVPLIFKKPMTARESIPIVKTKKTELAMDIEQNNDKEKEDKQIHRQASTLEDYPASDESGKQLVDIVFCCDTTSSMGEYLQATIDYITAIYKKTKPFEQIIDIRYGFVCYRDHPPEESSYLYRISNLNSPLKTIQFIQQQDAEGGGDTPEAVMDGLYVATSGINWRKQSMKYIIHIADAPPHGDIYTGASGGFLNRSFVWREGCPCGLTIEKIAKIMNSLQIHYRLIKAGDNMEKMASIFKSCIQHYADIKVDSPQGLDFILSDMVAKQCLSSEDIQNIPTVKRSSKNKSRSQSRNNDDIEYGQYKSSISDDISYQQQPLKGINRTYSNNYQAFRNNNEEEAHEILIEETQEKYQRKNKHQESKLQNEREYNQKSILQKQYAKYTANQLSKLPINYKIYTGSHQDRISYDNLIDLDIMD